MSALTTRNNLFLSDQGKFSPEQGRYVLGRIPDASASK